MAAKNIENFEINKPTTVYKADLQRVGSIIDETLTVLSEYNKVKDWQQVKNRVISQNMVNKQSSQTIMGILAAIHKRFFQNYEFLPSVEFLAKAVVKKFSKAIKTQLLYPYICESDFLVKNILLNLVANKIHHSQMFLTKDEVLEFLEKEQNSHPELRKWSEYLKKRWTRGFLAFLRDFNIMEKAPSNKLIKPSLRIETFAFFMLGLLDKNFSVKEILKNEIWHLYFLTNTEIEQFIVEMHARGWVHYSKAGEIIELMPKFDLERWLSGLE
ncbi:MAG: DUF1819 family protein [Nitrososphaeria archaeon]